MCSRSGFAAILAALALTTWPISAEAPPEEPTLVERITVTATRSEQAIKDTASSTSVVSSDEIERFGMTDTRDLLRYEPGVSVPGDPTRFGLGGFEIRGIGGNRVLTRIDGVSTAEQFSFGPVSAPQFALDLDTVRSVEISRSAGSALYGSDALGGVVDFQTKDPADYLPDPASNLHLGLRAGYDSRDSQASGLATAAFRGEKWQGLVQFTERSGEEWNNQGSVGGEGAARTEPNPQDRDSSNVLGKWNWILGAHSLLEIEGEWFDADSVTEALSLRGPSTPGVSVTDFDADDRQDRWRFSAEHTLAATGGALDHSMWRVWAQESNTLQRTVEQISRAAGPSRRDASFEFEEQNLGGEVQFRSTPGAGDRHRLTYGASVTRQNFDQFRDRTEAFVASGAPVSSALVFPTKYAPESVVLEAGLYVQDEFDLANGKLSLIPGLRYDHHDLDADQDDAVFLAGNPGSAPPADVADSALSPKLGVVGRITEGLSGFGQYARGFRAPPYSDVNAGFANLTFGYVTLPNPNLQSETSDNFEVGLRGTYGRGSFSFTVFDNHYDDFIETVDTGVSPDGLTEFQSQNVDRVTISGAEFSGDLAFGSHWIARVAGSWAEAEDETTDEPLESISPPQLVSGLRYRAAAERWQTELTGTYVAAKSEEDLPTGSTLFKTPSFVVVDLFGTLRVTRVLELQAGLYNLTDEKYWLWADVHGQQAGSVGIDRYTSPGFSAGANVRYSF